MNASTILIVEDEILIADTIKRYLEKSQYKVLATSISYEAAKSAYLNERPDLVILDIRLNGLKTGIDFAKFIKLQNNPCPIVYLTSQLDAKSINEAKATLPDAYLPKPIRRETLLTTVEIALHNHQARLKESVALVLSKSNKNYNVNSHEILLIQADHIYVEIYLVDNRKIVQRCSIKDILELLPPQNFIQTHRSYVINKAHVDKWDNQNLMIADHVVPVSRSRKKEVMAKLSN